MYLLTQDNSALPLEILDSLPNPVWLKDEKLHYVWVNKAFEALFHVTCDDVVGALEADLLQERAVMREGDNTALMTVFTPAGEPREIATQTSMLKTDDGVDYQMGVMQDVTALSQAQAAIAEQQLLLEAQAGLLRDFERMDPLTGCINRRALHERVAGQKPKAAVLMVGIDGFKAIIDAHSHDAGDEALKHFANIAHLNLRPNDILARVGGEAFTLYLPDATEQDSHEIGERIQHALSQSPLMFEGEHIPLTVSIGGCCNVEEEFQLKNQMRIADACLYEAKQAGHNKMVIAH